MISPLKLLIVITLSVITKSTFAQQTFSGINWGFKVGLIAAGFDSEVGPLINSGSYSDRYSTDQTGNLGLQFGGFIGYDFNDYIGLQADLQYSPKGDEFTRTSKDIYTVYSNGSTSSVDEFVKYKLKYIEIPLAVKVTPIRRFSLKLGIAPGFNISSKVEYNNWVNEEQKIDDQFVNSGTNVSVVNEETNKVDFDYATPVIVSGLGEIQYNMKRGFIYLSYSKSFNDVFTVNKINDFNYQTTQSYIGFGFAYRFIEY